MRTNGIKDFVLRVGEQHFNLMSSKANRFWMMQLNDCDWHYPLQTLFKSRHDRRLVDDRRSEAAKKRRKDRQRQQKAQKSSRPQGKAAAKEKNRKRTGNMKIKDMSISITNADTGVTAIGR